MFILKRIEFTLAVMSRKTIFLLAAAVVMLYFSIILFMLSPLHSSRGGYYAGGYLKNVAIRNYPHMKWCQELHWRSPPSADVVALVSCPGSGNTWLRYLLQQATGVVTGSIYMDYGLRQHGFPGENVQNGSVLVVKTHRCPSVPEEFRSAILLIRNPRDATFLTYNTATEDLLVLAEFNRQYGGHIGTAPKSAFTKKTNDWLTYVSNYLEKWEMFHEGWLTRFPGPLHIVFYEVLVSDTRRTLQGILDFLNYNVTEADMNCAIANKEGIYRRKKTHEDFDPFTPEIYRAMNRARNKVLRMAMEYKKNNDSELTLKQYSMYNKKKRVRLGTPDRSDKLN